MDIRAIFAGNLRRFRADAGVSQEELAHQVGIDRTYVSALERQVHGCSIDLVARLAEALRVSPAAMLAEPVAGPKAQEDATTQG